MITFKSRMSYLIADLTFWVGIGLRRPLARGERASWLSKDAALWFGEVRFVIWISWSCWKHGLRLRLRKEMFVKLVLLGVLLVIWMVLSGI